MKKIVPVFLTIIIIILLAVICCGSFFVINMKNEYDEKISKLDEKIVANEKQEENQNSTNKTTNTSNVENSSNKETNNSKPVVQNNQAEKNVISTKDLVTEMYSKSLTKDSINLNYRFPKINIDSLYVKEVNVQIEKQKNLAERAITRVNNYNRFPEYHIRTDYKYFIKDNILSVIIYANNEVRGSNIISIYNIDIQTGARIEKTDLLKTINITENEFQEKIFNIVSNKKEFYQFETYLLTNKESCALERCEIFYSNNGHVIAAIPVNGTDVAGQFLLDLNTNDVIFGIDSIK